jgi:hypothetical protein
MILLENSLRDAGHDQWLRHEILEARKTHADLLKWKLISVIALFSISLGLNPASPFLICLIPLCCVSVDLISFDLMIRIHEIETYFRLSGAGYEEYQGLMKTRALTGFASYGSSLLFHGSVSVCGLFLPRPSGQFPAVLAGAGFLGGVGTLFLWRMCMNHSRQVSDRAERFRTQGHDETEIMKRAARSPQFQNVDG